MSPADNSAGGALKRTPLHALHVELGARLVSYAGWELPVQYRGGIRHEHLHTRRQAGLFDVSHMGQFRLHGGGAAAAIETLVPGDISTLAAWRQRYTLFTNDEGGIVDDLIITRLPAGLHLVVNAARRDIDLALLRTRLEAEELEQQGMFALQGPGAEAALAALVPGVRELRFLCAGEFDAGGVRCLIARSGYTGEDGFEVSAPAASLDALARRVLQQPGVEPAGLGARDSLRLEAGLCLYGQDLDEATTPAEAGLAWTIAKHHRDNPAGARFPGAARILAELRTGPARRRVGLLPAGRMPIRAGHTLIGGDGRTVGRISSGGFGPSIDAPIAMGYVQAEFAKPGTLLRAEVRGHLHEIRVAALPFVPRHYHA